MLNLLYDNIQIEAIMISTAQTMQMWTSFLSVVLNMCIYCYTSYIEPY